MKPLESPARLRDGTEFRDVLKEFSNAPVSEARLAANAEAIAARVAAGASVGAAIVKLKSWLLGALAAGVLGAVVLRAITMAPSAPSAPEASATSASALDEDPAIRAPTIEGLPRAEPPAPVERAPRPRAKRMTTAPESSPDPRPSSESHAPPDGVDDLRGQIAAFESAKAAAAAGETPRALLLLDGLASRVPRSLLLPEVLVFRSEVLARAGRTAEARRDVLRAIEEPDLRAQRAELYRFLGDLEHQAGACERAIAAYRQALVLGLEPDRAVSVRAAITSCPGP